MTKFRKITAIAAAALILVSLLLAFGLRLGIMCIPRELYEYGNSSDWSDEINYSHVAVYVTSENGFEEDRIYYAESAIESACITESYETEYNRYGASREREVSVYRDGATNGVSCTATVYMGDYFLFHRIPLREGAYPSDNAVITDTVILDEDAAWQLFGSAHDVTGMEVEINGNIYTIIGVSERASGVYTKTYGGKPRIYIAGNSAGFRNEDIKYTTFDVMMPDPITKFAENAVSGAVGSSDAVIKNIDTRFDGSSLKEMLDGTVKLITDSTDTEYPFTEKATLILVLKAADLYSVERIAFIVSIVGAVILFWALYRPVMDAIGRLFKKLRS